MNFYQTLSIALLFLFNSVAFASSCRADQKDPYRTIDSIYELSEFVFQGELYPSAIKRDSRLIKVISKWKGPNIDEVQLDVYQRQPAGAPYFASPSHLGKGWYAYDLLCVDLYLPPDDTISAYLTRKYGAPKSQISDSLDIPTMLLIGGVFLGVGAMGIWTWSARNV
jgi:hypothetical protein